MNYIEGWALDITTRGKEHYYKDGISLCCKKQRINVKTT